MILRADAFSLPFRGGAFDVAICDPPYEVLHPANKLLRSAFRSASAKEGRRQTDVGYIEFAGRGWWREAWRVLKPDGHVYIFAAIKELPAWFAAMQNLRFDVISWVQPNARGIQSAMRRVSGGRTIAWRPILHYRKGSSLSWKRDDGRTDYVEPNYFIESQVQSNMAEAIAWPNQLPVRLVTWLLRPHRNARVLDLFSGTGTAREAAVALGLEVVSVDLSHEAIKLVAQRPLQLPIDTPCIVRHQSQDSLL